MEGSVDQLMQAKEILGLILESEKEDQLEELNNEQGEMIEATLAPRSSMVGQTLESLQFRDRFGFTVLAIQRHGEILTKRLKACGFNSVTTCFCRDHVTAFLRFNREMIFSFSSK